METIKVIGILVGIILMAIGVIMIYDARKLSEKWFNFHDSNTATKWFKIGGFIITIIGVLMLYFTK